MSHEIAEAAGDIAYWQQRAETAEAGNAAIVGAVRAYARAERVDVRISTWHALCEVAQADHPGDALLRELTQARRAVAAARARLAQTGIDADDRALMEAIEGYDEAVKARTE